MPRKYRSTPAGTNKVSGFRVRIREARESFSSYLVDSNSKSNASRRASKSKKGRVISVTKVSPEEILKIGEYFTIGTKLMKEFRKEERDKRVKERQDYYRSTTQQLTAKDKQITQNI